MSSLAMNSSADTQLAYCVAAGASEGFRGAAHGANHALRLMGRSLGQALADDNLTKNPLSSVVSAASFSTTASCAADPPHIDLLRELPAGLHALLQAGALTAGLAV